MTEPAQHQSPEDVRADFRADLIKRLFAVAISVGAATTLYQMHWVQHGRAPCLSEYQQLLILIAAMAATVLSWDGYLYAIKTRTLRTFWRFAIDILLVFIYLLLLMTSRLLTWWLFIHALIYALYAIWDVLTVYDWTEKYYDDAAQNEPRTVSGVYLGGITDRPGVRRGPIVTIAWGIYFAILCCINYLMLQSLNQPGLSSRIVGSTIVVVIALWLYRTDNIKQFTMCRRLAWIAALLLADAAYLTWLPTDETIWSWMGPYIGSAYCD